VVDGVARGERGAVWQNCSVASAADLAILREALDFVPSHISGSNTHAALAGACEALGLPIPPRADEGSKYERASASFVALPDAALPLVAEKVLAAGGLDARQRNTVQDALWATRDQPVIPKRTRREIARTLHLDDLIHDGERFTRLLDSLRVLDDDPLGVIFGGRRTLRDHIAQHVYRNSDWSAEELFERLGAFEASDKRFALFLEGFASADVVPEVEAQRRFVAAINPHLDRIGFELRETGDDGGYPVFSVVSTRSSRGRPKNLIFASAEKPDIRFSDAIDNDIEIVGNANSVLVYDRPIGPDGLMA
jgi:AbiJ N-terminal domain 3